MMPTSGSDTSDGIAEETLRRMLDPTQFLVAGTDEVNAAIQRLVEGPDIADIGTIERQLLKATSEWVALRQASAAFKAVTAAAWSRAFASFSQDTMTDPSLLARGPRGALDHWLKVANAELIRTQRTDAFLEAQRRLLSAGVDYRLKERALVEIWCETHSIPTRTEVDDVHRTLHELRAQVRDLRSRLATAEARAAKPAPRRHRRREEAILRGTVMSEQSYGPEQAWREALEFGARFAHSAEALGRIRDVDVDVGATPKTEVMRVEKVTLHHYTPLDGVEVKTGPVLIVYGLVGRFTMADLQEDRSLVRNLLGRGVDLLRGRMGQSAARRPVPDHRRLHRLVPRRLRRADPSGGRGRQGHAARDLRGRHFSTFYAARHSEKVQNLSSRSRSHVYALNLPRQISPLMI